MSNQSKPTDKPQGVTRVAPKLSSMSFGELMQSLKKGVDIEDLRRAERG
ncbi:hypothetical protein [Azotobacter vinelandii]|nr:hypothetical protein [Azotobacter vinelandii]SFY30355.1 hypothetical protein SAMN04244547_04987 [Azotobacter vinelandii]